MEKIASFLSMQDNFGIDSVIIDGNDKLNGSENSKPGFFAYSVLKNIPYIDYPFLTENESAAVFFLAKECLVRSKQLYHYSEVSATYKSDMDLSDPKAVVFTHGNEMTTSYLNDPNVDRFLRLSNELLFVTMHNHPNNSRLSLEDLTIFCSQPNIKFLGAVGHNGMISFAIRENPVDLSYIPATAVKKFVPDEKLSNLKKDIFNHLSKNEKALIQDYVMDEMEKQGIFMYSKVSIEDVPLVMAKYERMSGEYDDR